MSRNIGPAGLSVIASVTALLLVGALPFVAMPSRADSFYSIRNDATGGDCYLIGTWDRGTKTCALTTDVTGIISIDSNGITLDGSGHSVSSSYWPIISLISRSGVVVRNTAVQNVAPTSVSRGIQLAGGSSGNTITGNTLTGGGIFLFQSNGNAIVGNTVLGPPSSTRGERDIQLDGNGNTVAGNTLTGGSYGVLLWGRDNTVSGNRITDASASGITVGGGSRDITVTGNTISSNTGSEYPVASINIAQSTGASLSGNVMTNGELLLNGIGTGYRREYWSSHAIDASNTVDGKPVYYLKGKACSNIPSDAGQLILVDCPGAVVENRNLKSIELAFSPGSTIRSNVVSARTYGINLAFSGGSTVVGNTVSGNMRGIAYSDSPAGMIQGNTVTRGGMIVHVDFVTTAGTIIEGNSVSGGVNLFWGVSGVTVTRNIIANGIGVISSSDNTISGNSVLSWGLGLLWANGNTISGNAFSGSPYLNLYEATSNTIRENTFAGDTVAISLSRSDGNTIYHNNFIGITIQFSSLGTNDWELSSDSCRAGVYSCEGNYWSDYDGLDDGTGVGKWGEARHAADSVGDTAVPHRGLDWYPLMDPWP